MTDSDFLQAAKLIQAELDKFPHEVNIERNSTEEQRYLEYHAQHAETPFMPIWKIGYLAALDGRVPDKKIFFVARSTRPGVMQEPYLFFNIKEAVSENGYSPELISEFIESYRTGKLGLVEHA